MGGRSSTSTTPFIPCLTANCQATEIPAIPAPQMTTSAVVVFTMSVEARDRSLFRGAWPPELFFNLFLLLRRQLVLGEELLDPLIRVDLNRISGIGVFGSFAVVVGAHAHRIPATVRSESRCGVCTKAGVDGWKSEIRNPKSEIPPRFPAMMIVPAAGVAEWQTLGT